MNIYPAIDLKNGVCVRLKMGDMRQATEYGDPAEIAAEWQRQGARYLHVVDLDAAFAGEFCNRGTVARILKAVSIPVQLGGGIRTLADIEERLDMGIQRVIIGTAAIEMPEMVREAVKKYPGRIVAGIDAKDGRVATRGWASDTGEDPVRLALNMKDMGINTVIYTDISRDGMLMGPNVAGVRNMVKSTGMDIIASGGMSELADVTRILDTGAEGIIIGKALYAGTVRLNDAIAMGEGIC
jgi:phosphoribosylformimino-5-aminoimidazole carboxamide ribotide isomerase